MPAHPLVARTALSLFGVLALAACGNDVAEAPVFSPAGGIHLQPVDVSLSTATADASIRYTYAPDTPSETNGTLYDGAIHVTAPVEIRAIAYRSGLDPSSVVSETYEVYQSAPIAPLLDPGPGTYLPPVLVEMTTATPTANIAYTLDGTVPAPGNALYYGGTPVQIDETTEVRAVAYEAGILSLVSEAVYTIAEGEVAAPELTPEPGRLLQLEPVAISSATPGAEIRFTTDGSFPTCTTGTVYTAALTLQTGDELSAVACKAGWIDSEVVSGEYEFGIWLAAGSDGVIRKSTDRGETWTDVQQWPSLSFTGLATDGFGAWVAVARDGSVRYSYDRGETWQSSVMDLSVVEVVQTDTFGNWIAGGHDDLPPSLRDSSNVGASWGTPIAPATTSAVKGVATAGVTWVAVAGSGQILRSGNSSSSWTEVYDAPSTLNSVATDGMGHWVAAGGNLFPPGQLYIVTSTDDGQSWQATTDALGPGFTTVAADPSGTFLAAGQGVFRSLDGGLTWTSLGILSVSQPVEHLATDGGGRWLATIDRAVYASDDNGLNWSQQPLLPVGAKAGVVVFGY